jgi:hypothetical protein
VCGVDEPDRTEYQIETRRQTGRHGDRERGMEGQAVGYLYDGAQAVSMSLESVEAFDEELFELLEPCAVHSSHHLNTTHNKTHNSTHNTQHIAEQ